MKIKSLIVDILKFLLMYAVSIVAAVTIYVHLKFNMVSLDNFLLNMKDVIDIEWALIQIKIYLAILFFVSFFISWFLKTKYLIILSILLLLLPVYEFKIISYFYYKNTTTDFFEKNYVEPIIKKEKKNNLIIVYLESFEEHFINENVTPFLAKIKKENTSFNGFYQISSTFSTIYAQYASLCGMPIKQNPSEYTNFAPNIKCIPDLLKENGYENMYIKGANITFSRANHFAEQHSFNKIKGKVQLEKQASKITKNYQGNRFDGLRDKILFEIAKEELSSLKEPFFASFTTLDMHATPELFLDPECEKKFNDERDIIACTDKNLENFINWLQKQPFWENTTLVLLGDHKINSRYLSKSNPINIFINSQIQTTNLNRSFTTFDYAPTIMEAMGYNIEKFGIGRSLFTSKETLFEKEGNNIEFLVKAKNKLYDEMKKFKDTKATFNPYKLETKLNNKTIMDNYTDFGEKNNWCNKITSVSMNLDKLPDNGVYLKMKYLKINNDFSIYINNHLIYENEVAAKNKLKDDTLIVHLPKSYFKNDKNLTIDVSSIHNSMNFILGLCIKELVVSEKE